MSDEKKIAASGAPATGDPTSADAAPALTPEGEAELEAAEKAAEEFDELGLGGYVHKFRKPFTYMGNTYEKMTFNFENLTGKDMLSIGQELQLLRLQVSNPTLNLEFQTRVAVRACTERITSPAGKEQRVLDVTALQTMPAFDFHCITGMARNFLMSADLHAQKALVAALASHAGSKSKP